MVSSTERFPSYFLLRDSENDLSIACQSPGKWTSSVKHDPVNLNSKISQHKVMMLMFSQELIWRGEICYTNIVVFGLILNMRKEDALLEKWCVSLPFIRSRTSSDQSRPRGSRAFCLSPRTIDERFRNWNCYLCMLIDFEVYSIVTYSFRKTKYADWLRRIFWCFLLVTFGKVTRWQ